MLQSVASGRAEPRSTSGWFGATRRRCVTALAVVLAICGTGAPVQAAEPTPALYSPDGDPLFAQPYIDVDEWRDAPVRHRYVHGGFKGTETRFSFYLPPKAHYRGRFFQYITPVPISENTSQSNPTGEDNKIGFAIDSGAYFVETNTGGVFDLGKMATLKVDPTISGYRANAAAAAYSRVVAQQMYGGKRPYGYAFGGSGGAFRTIGLMENTRGVWDGAVPYVVGSTQAIPNMFTARIRAMRIVGSKLNNVVDAASPGGGGDIYAGLSPLQVDALREVTRLGFPPQSWYMWRTMGIHGLAALYPGIAAADPTYFTDFWTKPGYLGHDHPEQFADARLQFASKVAQPITAADAARARINIDASSEHQQGGVDTAFKVPAGAAGERIAAFRLAAPPPTVTFIGGDLVVLSGAAKGKRLPLARIVGDVVVLGTADPDVARQIAPGDEIQVDNSNFLALETYHRHQTPPLSEGFYVWDQFRNADGSPKYPQRPKLLGPMFIPTVGRKETGEIQGKIIILESLWDREAMPWQADWYRTRVRQHFGDRTDQMVRVWFTNHAVHGDFNPKGMGEDPTRVVSYVPVLHQALRDLAAWVEKGTPPPASTSYKVVDGQVIVAPTAAQRRGVQPVVVLKVDGAERAEISVGQPVTLRGRIETPPGAGSIVAADWDCDGKGTFSQHSATAAGAGIASVTTTCRFSRPGTYFPALRAVSQRNGDRQTPYARIQNLGRVRVVVR
ncbi:hypothetical protein LJR225_001818 [Phenylobacterium sp. LjRoot225]|uniref:hypothetical protein n=1 Tax=Phenylobacterium sp. LjRoot225 TaxID=3342285 RepID=UPI003ED0D228